MSVPSEHGAHVAGHARGIAAATLGVMLMLAGIAPASAQADYCTDTCGEYENGTCVNLRHQCYHFEPPDPGYGAIAYGRASKAWGASYHWESQSKAESVAMQKCKENGDDCEVMVWFKGQCGAVAAGEGTDAFWGLGGSAAQARAQAQSKCEEGGGKGCEIEASECSR